MMLSNVYSENVSHEIFRNNKSRVFTENIPHLNKDLKKLHSTLKGINVGIRLVFGI